MDETDYYIFLVLKMIYYTEGDDHYTAEQVSIIFGKNLVISFQEKEGDVFNSVRERIRKTVPRSRFMGTDYLAYALVDAVVDNYFKVLERLGEQIEEYYQGSGYRYPFRSVMQTELLGQAHAIWLARENLSGPVLIIFVDTIFEADLSGLETSGLDGVLYVKEVEDPRRFGVTVLGDDGLVTRIVEKPDTVENRLAVIGAYYVRDAGWLLRAIEDLR